ncbi:MAG: glycoside hydrolase [Epsilonproteobacteria bacterium]|nr:MAG: glycoside hydrolase [Campylobacterota bacterium]
MMRLFYLLMGITILMLSGCSPKIDNGLQPKDLDYYSQYPAIYAAQNVVDRTQLESTQNGYMKNYYRIWNTRRPPEPLEKIIWPLTSYTAGKRYGENLKLLPQEWFDRMIVKSNLENYGSLNRYALTLHFSHLRNFPTHKPLFSDPRKAGEGYPFDYLQNSGVHANEPLFVSHYSDDGAWVYVFTAYATGWLPSDAIVYLDADQVNAWQDKKHIRFTKEFYPLKDEEGHFIFYSRIGMLLPMIREEEDAYVLKVSTGDAFNSPHFLEVKIPKSTATLTPLLLARSNLTLLSSEIMQSKYGWGGLNESRDCSSTLRDLFTPFGIWLPRNSYQQGQIGKVIPLENLSNSEKVTLIKAEGIPFETLLYLRGHIVLYLGEYEGNIMILHNMWGIRTFTDVGEGRVIVGRTVISTLEIGKEIKGFDSDHSLLSKLKSMNILTKSKRAQTKAIE